MVAQERSTFTGFAFETTFITLILSDDAADSFVKDVSQKNGRAITFLNFHLLNNAIERFARASLSTTITTHLDWDSANRRSSLSSELIIAKAQFQQSPNCCAIFPLVLIAGQHRYTKSSMRDLSSHLISQQLLLASRQFDDNMVPSRAGDTSLAHLHHRSRGKLPYPSDITRCSLSCK